MGFLNGNIPVNGILFFMHLVQKCLSSYPVVRSKTHLHKCNSLAVVIFNMIDFLSKKKNIFWHKYEMISSSINDSIQKTKHNSTRLDRSRPTRISLVVSLQSVRDARVRAGLRVPAMAGVSSRVPSLIHACYLRAAVLRFVYPFCKLINTIFMQKYSSNLHQKYLTPHLAYLSIFIPHQWWAGRKFKFCHTNFRFVPDNTRLASLVRS